MPAKWLAIFFLFLSLTAGSQVNSAEEKLAQKIQHAATEEEKIKALGELAEFYYANNLEKSGDSAQQQQLLIAQLSTNKELVLRALFDNSITSISRWSKAETYERALAFIQKGLDFARDRDLNDYMALAYIRKADLLKKRGQYEKAIEEASHAFAALENAGYDSLKAVLYLELGNILLAKDEGVKAYQNYNKAYDIAYDIKNHPLQSQAYHCFADLYNKLNKKDLAENYLLKSVELNKSGGDKKGLLMDYINLARYIEKKDYIDRVLLLAKELNSYRYYLYGKKLMLAYLMVIQKNSREALNYLNSHPDLKQSYLNRGIHDYHHTIANIYMYGNQPDSAVAYYLLSIPQISTSYDPANQLIIYKQLGNCYVMLQQPQKAIDYFEKAIALNKENRSLTNDTTLARHLSQLYVEVGNFKKALEYNRLYHSSKEQLQGLADARQVVLLEMDREEKKRAKDIQNEEARKLKQRNLQFIGISIAIAVLFFFMILIGMFPVSKLMIRMVNFFAFICLFEFIILLIDTYIHHKTHGDALKIWLFKIGIIAILLPLHHLLEHTMEHFLESKKLMELRKQLSLKKLLTRHKKESLPVKEAGVEQDTAVL